MTVSFSQDHVAHKLHLAVMLGQLLIDMLQCPTLGQRTVRTLEVRRRDTPQRLFRTSRQDIARELGLRSLDFLQERPNRAHGKELSLPIPVRGPTRHKVPHPVINHTHAVSKQRERRVRSLQGRFSVSQVIAQKSHYPCHPIEGTPGKVQIIISVKHRRSFISQPNEILVTGLAGDLKIAETCVTCQDGYMSFVFVSGNPALDFVGTLKWRRSEPEELLQTPKDLEAWATSAGVLTAPFGASAEDLHELIDFRESLYRLVSALLEGRPADTEDVRKLNARLQAPAPSLHFEEGHLKRTGNASSLAAALGVAAAELLASDDANKLKECGRQDCTRIFIDRSRSGTRTWCGMEECGNRIKAANYRRRKSLKTLA
jgi:predicted RNA-binding Zn ribbon-like protein